MSRWMSVARGVAGVVVGYPLMGLLITLVQETWLGGVSWHTSTPLVLAAGGIGTFLCAVAAGAVAAMIAPHRPLLVAGVMSAIVVAETTWLIRTGRADGPLWFDVAAASSLIVGLLLGASWRRLPGMPGQAGRAPRRISTFQTRN